MAAHGRPRPSSFCSLADVEPGDPLEVVHVLFGSLRYRYEASGLTPGARARCRERTPDRIRLELADGRIAEVDATHASFVEVSLLAPDGRSRAPAHSPSPLAVLRSGGPEAHPSPP